jgi:hypothetical protein
MNNRILRHIIYYCVGMLFVSLATVQGVVASTVAVTSGSDPTVNGTNFQNAINSAACGDTIVLTAGATYQTPSSGSPFLLKNKGACTSTDADYITITTSASLPNGRLDPSVSGPSLAKIRSVAAYVIQQEANAHHYRLIGLDISTTGVTSNYVPDLVHWGNEGSAPGGYPTMAEILAAKNFEMDRCFVHSAELSSSQLVNNAVLYRTSGRGIAINGVNITIKNSYIAGFTGYYPSTTTKIDSYGIYMTIGPGPLTITNNYIEAGFNNIFTGEVGGCRLT